MRHAAELAAAAVNALAAAMEPAQPAARAVRRTATAPRTAASLVALLYVLTARRSAVS
jgi:hypothetical protein